MPLELEIEILAGQRAWPKTQQLFAGPPDPTRASHFVAAGWYDTAVDPFPGAFCIVRSGSALEELVGDYVVVNYKDQEVFVYCVGAAGMPYDLALARRAFFALEDLATESIDVSAQARL